jgi:hypothetical protein
MRPIERLILRSLRELLDSQRFGECRTGGEDGLLVEIDTALGSAPEKRRGRRGMGEEERVEVSARMKRYWAGRRAGAHA